MTNIDFTKLAFNPKHTRLQGSAVSKLDYFKIQVCAYVLNRTVAAQIASWVSSAVEADYPDAIAKVMEESQAEGLTLEDYLNRILG